MEEAYTERDPRIWHFSRIPAYGEDNEDLVGLVERRTLGQCYADGKTSAKLNEIMRPLHFCAGKSAPGSPALGATSGTGTSICSNSTSMAVWLVWFSLEDVLEEILW